MFKKLVAIEPISLIDSAKEEIRKYAKEVIFYDTIPTSDDEIIKRIGDSDGVLVSYTSKINQYVLESCKNIRYIGMCCSLYSKESANVDITYAEAHDIVVKGIRDYGDRGVVEFVLSELIRFLHGYDRPMFKETPIEITGLNVGIIGMGVTGGMIADALYFLGADISYYSRTRKSIYEEQGIKYKDLHTLLKTNEIIITCLNKNVILLHEEEFKQLGNHKLLFNTSIGPSFDVNALKDWLQNNENYFVCDTEGAIGDETNTLIKLENVICAKASAGMTKQAYGLLSEKVLNNIRSFINER